MKDLHTPVVIPPLRTARNKTVLDYLSKPSQTRPRTVLDHLKKGDRK